MIFRLNTLYKRDSNGRVREYNIEWTDHGVAQPGYRTVAGIQGGKMVTSEWKYTEGKNIGKVNETTPSEQAEKDGDLCSNGVESPERVPYLNFVNFQKLWIGFEAMSFFFYIY